MCLSLLGTWAGGSAGEEWTQHCSILQVLISIQSLIMVDEPFFNEPSFEKQRGTHEGTVGNKAYASIVRYGTVRYAMTEAMRKPPKGFEDAVKTHFSLRKEELKAQLETWVCEAKNDPDAGQGYGSLVSSHNNVLAAQFKSSKDAYHKALKTAVADCVKELNKLK